MNRDLTENYRQELERALRKLIENLRGQLRPDEKLAGFGILVGEDGFFCDLMGIGGSQLMEGVSGSCGSALLYSPNDWPMGFDEPSKVPLRKALRNHEQASGQELDLAGGYQLAIELLKSCRDAFDEETLVIAYSSDPDEEELPYMRRAIVKLNPPAVREAALADFDAQQADY